MSLLQDQHIRSVLWMFSAFAPIIAIGLLALSCWRPARGPALGTLLFSSLTAGVLTVVFHFAYVVPIWKTHSSAIWLLDRAGFTAAFAIGACGSTFACLVYYGCGRHFRIRPRKTTNGANPDVSPSQPR